MKKWIAGIYFTLVFKWKNYRLQKLLEEELTPSFSSSDVYGVHQNDTQRKYLEGLANLKRSINSKVKSRNKDEYHRVLSDVKELVALGRVETKTQRMIRETLTSICKLPEVNRKEMINQRIEHYEELHKYKEQRELIKKAKQARKEGDIELAEQLETKWREQNGQVRNPR